jgi:uncharacterized protein (DUF2147 family)
MKFFGYLAVLMVLSPAAYAGDSFSFVVGGHRIQIEAPRHCGSPSCVSISIPGIYQTRRRDRYDDAPEVAAPVKPPTPVAAQVSPRPVAPPPPPPRPIAAPSVAATQPTVSPRPSVVQASQPLSVTPPIKATPAETTTDVTRPVPEVVPQISGISREADDDPAGTPVGDWQADGQKGSVRIEPCGRALCGYVLDEASGAKAESVLINMKPKAASGKPEATSDKPEAASEWSGNIYSRESGRTYYATIAMTEPNSLRVEACALGKFFCSGHVWRRIGANPERTITSRQISLQSRS